MSLLNRTNTSVTVMSSKAPEAGVLTAKTSIPITPAIASALGLPSSLPIEVRKRLVAASNSIAISGEFSPSDSLAIFKISNFITGIPLSWQLSDNTNFRIVSSAADSVVVEALQYNKSLTLTATMGLVEATISKTKTVTSPKLNISVPLLNCEETEISLYPHLASGFNAIQWSVANSSYLQITGQSNQPTVKVKGLRNTVKGPGMEVKATVNGEIITATQAVDIAIPEQLSLTVIQQWEEGDYRYALIHAAASPANEKELVYNWSASQGSIWPRLSKPLNLNGLTSTKEFNIRDLSTIPIPENVLPASLIRQLLEQESNSISVSTGSALRSESTEAATPVATQTSAPLKITRVASTRSC
ncbi:hypothetical protein FACS189413_17840 [Bacteroidia bacterium]|nr:hypothetical protein FACS189413_17840 [Bacteroidia bacterium]